ncbi:hypothetical protein NST23_26385 [Brevibacillus sp. FSL K6-0770]|jgi:hypothetical protein|uniref:Uncharacterized protein n=1 Tax=Brevibacillus parabrevis TaxID=54914 RepID=A0A4Y3PCR0_BREPA|nr:MULTISPECIES: hypothetical protein [Brevibacillus]MDH6350995.1 hypothetical protein [Brevibacillus sp. 1238]NRQ53352.1 hypothetical protein [Brevibacillus sp. HD1.4A]RNB97240.1 hypothetical protein EDM60_02650 [Brevibacillus parabrevis]GEB31274.1 hypothetical protein BPA01_08540 [Brevibacillus parabrevis]HBZ81870.1 hypothetical protein [Brevibacillus sp.]
MFRKKTFVTLLTTVLSLTAFSSVSFAEGNVRYYSDSEIQKIAQEQTNNEWQSNFGKSSKNIAPRSDSMYKEWPVSYVPSYTENKRDAFEIAEFSFDTRDEAGSTTELTVSYNESSTVQWTISGGLSAKAEFNVIAVEVEASVNGSVARASSTSEGIGASKKYNLYTGRTGSIKIYAHGVRTGGAVKYKWQDVSGNSGFKTRTVNARLPYSEYDTGKIHFGKVTYD